MDCNYFRKFKKNLNEYKNKSNWNVFEKILTYSKFLALPYICFYFERFIVNQITFIDSCKKVWL